MDQGLPEMEEDTMSSQLKKKYSAEKDYKKIVKYAKKRKRNKFGQQIDLYWKKRDLQRLVDRGVINTQVKVKEIKKLLDEIK
jgi:hypothetical protein